MGKLDEFYLKVDPLGKKCEFGIDGKKIPNVRSVRISCDVNNISRIDIGMFIMKPFEINGKGEITVDAIVVDKDIARKVYESLKKIFGVELKI